MYIYIYSKQIETVKKVVCRNGALAIYTYIHAAVICHVSHLGS